MGWLPNLLWAVGCLILGVLIYRGRKADLLGQYRYFYTYVLAVLCSQVTNVYLAAGDKNSHLLAPMVWGLEILTALFGFGVTWEIYKQTLLPYVGARRMARTVLSAVFMAVVLNAAVELSNNPVRNLGPTTLELERNLRVIQALFLMALVGLIVHYSIPLGRNLLWMLVGYGALVASGVITLTLSSQFAHINWSWWSLPIQIEYCATLTAWCVGLWSYAPNPAPGVALQQDYDRISAQTSRAFGRVRDHLLQPWSE